ncbi:MAG: exodeoxyribonuclease V subunit alpha, partial [Burkholderiales bacterium]|nr:exodeoxyribonuclease V subunit alpha [Burkholderiales bacterium]
MGYLAVLESRRPPPAADPEAFDSWARAVLRAYGHFQLLTPVRQGPWGVEALNQRVQHLLAQGPHALLPEAAERPWFEGRPVMVTRNDYALGLMNGDIGIALRLPWGSGPGSTRAERRSGSNAPQLRVAFLTSSDIRWVLPSRLQAVETAFALTVHKAQGSEFEHIALVLPDTDVPILTRE